MVSQKISCGHGLKVYANGICRSCYEKMLRLKNPEYAERQRANCRDWTNRNSKKKSDSDKKWRSELSPKRKKELAERARALEKNYDMSMDEYQYLIDLQSGICAICHTHSSRALQVDHNHSDGTIRGLLCGNCNKALGLVHDEPSILRAMVLYLERNGLDMGGPIHDS